MDNYKLYAAYGSNLNLEQMAMRCPDAEPVCKTMLKGWQLEFRSVATIVPIPDAETPIGIWKIKQNDEEALDRYEGYPRLYRKEYLEIEIDGELKIVMVYIMNRGEPSLPPQRYLNTIRQGYMDVGLEMEYLDNALIYTKNSRNKIESSWAERYNTAQRS